jgi:hypothetical protein
MLRTHGKQRVSIVSHGCFPKSSQKAVELWDRTDLGCVTLGHFDGAVKTARFEVFFDYRRLSVAR